MIYLQHSKLIREQILMLLFVGMTRAAPEASEYRNLMSYTGNSEVILRLVKS